MPFRSAWFWHTFVTSRNPAYSIHTVLVSLGHAFLDFLSHAAIGAVSVLAILLGVGLGMPRRAAVPIRKILR